jgi:hypothetical protein
LITGFSSVYEFASIGGSQRRCAGVPTDRLFARAFRDGREVRLSLLDWRRRVFALYADVRRTPDHRAAHQLWRNGRDELLGRHPDSPIPYGGGRYLLDTVKGADLGGGDGWLVVDLNFAYNPSCAYDAAWACPLAPPGNVVAAPVAVGELHTA